MRRLRHRDVVDLETPEWTAVTNHGQNDTFPDIVQADWHCFVADLNKTRLAFQKHLCALHDALANELYDHWLPTQEARKLAINKHDTTRRYYVSDPGYAHFRVDFQVSLFAHTRAI